MACSASLLQTRPVVQRCARSCLPRALERPRPARWLVAHRLRPRLVHRAFSFLSRFQHRRRAPLTSRRRPPASASWTSPAGSRPRGKSSPTAALSLRTLIEARTLPCRACRCTPSSACAPLRRLHCTSEQSIAGSGTLHSSRDWSWRWSRCSPFPHGQWFRPHFHFRRPHQPCPRLQSRPGKTFPPATTFPSL